MFENPKSIKAESINRINCKNIPLIEFYRQSEMTMSEIYNKTKRKIGEMKEFAISHNLKIPPEYKTKAKIISYLVTNISKSELELFLLESSQNNPKVLKLQKSDFSDQNINNIEPLKERQSEFALRMSVLEKQVQELTIQFTELRANISRRSEISEKLDPILVWKTAQNLSKSILTPLDELQKMINPDHIPIFDKQLRDCLVDLMDDGKIQLQEMKSQFQIQIRTDIFGGFKA